MRLAKFKLENKELLSYILYHSTDEDGFIKEVKAEIVEEFQNINTASYYYIKKSVRKILRSIKKYIRYSKLKQTEVEILICFCLELKGMRPSMTRSIPLSNLYDRQVLALKKALSTLHEDLQFDYESDIENL